MKVEAVLLGISIFFFLMTLFYMLLIFSAIRPRQIRKQFGEEAKAELQKRWNAYRESSTGSSILVIGGCSLLVVAVSLCLSIAIFIIRYFFG